MAGNSNCRKMNELSKFLMTSQIKRTLGMQKVRFRDGFQGRECFLPLLKVPIPNPDQFSANKARN